jgi:hypothetical protein
MPFTRVCGTSIIKGTIRTPTISCKEKPRKEKFKNELKMVEKK